jgi:hypothetical protein
LQFLLLLPDLLHDQCRGEPLFQQPGRVERKRPDIPSGEGSRSGMNIVSWFIQGI